MVVVVCHSLAPQRWHCQAPLAILDQWPHLVSLSRPATAATSDSSSYSSYYVSTFLHELWCPGPICIARCPSPAWAGSSRSIGSLRPIGLLSFVAGSGRLNLHLLLLGGWGPQAPPARVRVPLHHHPLHLPCAHTCQPFKVLDPPTHFLVQHLDCRTSASASS